MILVTGAGGWLGSELVKQLLEKGNKVRALNNVETEKLKELRKKYNNALEIVIGDVCDQKCVKKNIENIKQVFHLAAKVHYIPTNKKEEEDFFKVNTEASENIFKECINNKIKRVVFFSTVSVYEQSDRIINEKSNKNPNTIYGKSKLEAEKIGNKLYLEQSLPITIIEPVTVYGEGDVGNFKKLENLIKKGICIKFGKGENKKTLIYYKDLINMVINISNNEECLGKTIICGTEVLTINEINEILIQKSNKKIIKLYISNRMTNFIKKICSILKFKKLERKINALIRK